MTEAQIPTADEQIAPETAVAEETSATEVAAEPIDQKDEQTAESETDYAQIIADDIKSLKQQFDELSSLEDITELENPLRYAALRDLGLSPREAYLATSGARRARDTRSHLTGTVPKGAASPRGSMTSSELAAARDLFVGMSDSQIQALYKRVNN